MLSNKGFGEKHPLIVWAQAHLLYEHEGSHLKLSWLKPFCFGVLDSSQNCGGGALPHHFYNAGQV